MPREGCYGDMDGEPGVRNYGTMDPDDLFDVYCYVEETDGMNYNPYNIHNLMKKINYTVLKITLF